MMRRARLHELLAKAGGITERASGTIQIVHTEPEMCLEPGEVLVRTSLNSSLEAQLEIYKLSDLKMGKEDADPYIRPGDIVIFTEGEPIYVTGAVVSPRELFLKDQLTLATAIAMAGGPARLAKTSEVHIYRQKPGQSGQEDLKFNYSAIRKGLQPDVLLKPLDIIDVKTVGPFSAPNLIDILKGFQSTAIQRAIIY